MTNLTHFNEQGRAKMVDISGKSESDRTAVAGSSITVNQDIYQQISEGNNKKGDVFAVAQVAGIMAAKNTAQLIPMCHPLPLTSINILFEWVIDQSRNLHVISIQAIVKTKGSTGVEMEALVAVTTAALTIYDMCKAASKNLTIGETVLLSKTGGKNGDYRRDPP